MAKSYMKIFFDQKEELDTLEPEEFKNVVMALLSYAEDGTLPELDGRIERFAFSSMKKIVDVQNEAYAQKCEKNRQNINRRWEKEQEEEKSEPKQDTTVYDRIPNDTKSYDRIFSDTKSYQKYQEQEQEQEKEKEQEQKRENARAKRAFFQKPTAKEVQKYCDERRNGINGESFVDFYASKGWKVGNQPMKDWKAAVRTWEKRDRERGSPPKQGQKFIERGYSQQELRRKIYDPLDDEGGIV